MKKLKGELYRMRKKEEGYKEQEKERTKQKGTKK
jgi:hypothetical protein